MNALKVLSDTNNSKTGFFFLEKFLEKEFAVFSAQKSQMLRRMGTPVPSTPAYGWI